MTDLDEPAAPIEEDPSFQRAEQRLQPVAWALMGSLLLAGGAGLFGAGPLSHAVAGDRGGPLWIEHERFARWEGTNEVHIHLTPAASPPGKATLVLGGDLLRGLEIERVTPPPVAVEAHRASVHHVFLAPDPGAEITVTLHLRPERWGRQTATIGVPGGPELAFTQLVYP